MAGSGERQHLATILQVCTIQSARPVDPPPPRVTRWAIARALFSSEGVREKTLQFRGGGKYYMQVALEAMFEYTLPCFSACLPSTSMSTQNVARARYTFLVIEEQVIEVRQSLQPVTAGSCTGPWSEIVLSCRVLCKTFKYSCCGGTCSRAGVAFSRIYHAR